MSHGVGVGEDYEVNAEFMDLNELHEGDSSSCGRWWGYYFLAFAIL